ncbi:MAG: hypothetical protein AAF570_19525, partial [Bacteroidota bacterium]
RTGVYAAIFNISDRHNAGIGNGYLFSGVILQKFLVLGLTLGLLYGIEKTRPLRWKEEKKQASE